MGSDTLIADLRSALRLVRAHETELTRAYLARVAAGGPSLPDESFAVAALANRIEREANRLELAATEAARVG